VAVAAPPLALVPPLLLLSLRSVVLVSWLPRFLLLAVRVRRRWWRLPFPVASFLVPPPLLFVAWAAVPLQPVPLCWFGLWRLRLPRFGSAFRVGVARLVLFPAVPGFRVAPVLGPSAPLPLV